uniref:hypothetical protein n=1 Tax=Yoonia sp. TaxID=2212373 RepID=UPI0040476B1C
MRKKVYKKNNSGTALSRKERKQVVKITKQVFNRQVETHHLDTSLITSYDTTGGMALITDAITQGVSDTQRVGDKLQLMRIAIRGLMAVGDATNIIRLIVFQWKSTSFTPPTLLDVLQTASVTSHRSFDIKSNIAVISDNTYYLNDAERRVLLINKSYKPKIKTIKFEGAGINATNHIYVLGLSDSGGVPNPVVNLNFRITFKDA